MTTPELHHHANICSQQSVARHLVGRQPQLCLGRLRPHSPGIITGLSPELLPHTGILRSRLETAQVLRYINGIGYSLTVSP